MWSVDGCNRPEVSTAAEEQGGKEGKPRSVSLAWRIIRPVVLTTEKEYTEGAKVAG